MKQRDAISPGTGKMGYFSPPEPNVAEPDAEPDERDWESGGENQAKYTFAGEISEGFFRGCQEYF